MRQTIRSRRRTRRQRCSTILTSTKVTLVYLKWAGTSSVNAAAKLLFDCWYGKACALINESVGRLHTFQDARMRRRCSRTSGRPTVSGRRLLLQAENPCNLISLILYMSKSVSVHGRRLLCMVVSDGGESALTFAVCRKLAFGCV